MSDKVLNGFQFNSLNNVLGNSQPNIVSDKHSGYQTPNYVSETQIELEKIKSQERIKLQELECDKIRLQNEQIKLKHEKLCLKEMSCREKELELQLIKSKYQENNADISRKTANLSTFRGKLSIISSLTVINECFRGNVANCMIAVQMAYRLNLDAFIVVDNMQIIHGKIAFSSKFLISIVNSCGKFDNLKFKFTGQDMDKKCTAYATNIKSKGLCEQSVSIQTAHNSGWIAKNKLWNRIPDLMLQYRTAAFFCRTYAPEYIMGYSVEEIQDFNENKEIL